MLDTGQVKHFEHFLPIMKFFYMFLFPLQKMIFCNLSILKLNNLISGITTHSSVFRMRSVSGDGIRGMTRCNIPSKFPNIFGLLT